MVSCLMSITPPASFDTLFKTYSGCVYVTNAGNSSITMREVIITSIFWGLDQKTFLFEGLSWFRFNYLGLVLGMTSKYDSSLAKGLKLSVRKFWRLISVFKKKLLGKIWNWSVLFDPSPSFWIGLRQEFDFIVSSSHLGAGRSP